MDDLLGIGALGTRLIDAFEKACGAGFRPWIIRRDAAATSDATVILAKAEAERETLLGEARIGVAQRALERLSVKEISRQENLEQIAHKAADEAAQFPEEEREADKPPIDPDWMARFVNKAQDVSNEDMQQLWARIVAGEVHTPGKFSLRTLDKLSNITKEEAHIFNKLCEISTELGAVLKYSIESQFDDIGIKYNDLMLLRASGLLYDSDTIELVGGPGKFVQANGNVRIVISSDNNDNTFMLKTLLMTPEGVELKNITNSSPNIEYYIKLGEHLTSQNLHCNVVENSKDRIKVLYISPKKEDES